MNCRYVDIEEVSHIHQAIIKQAGTSAQIRDFTLLHSAVERPKATFDYKSLYPTIWLKAAALLQSLCRNHPFSDGNKRTAWASTKRFLHLNGYHLKATPIQGTDFMVTVDTEKLDLPAIATWLQRHTKTFLSST